MNLGNSLARAGRFGREVALGILAACLAWFGLLLGARPMHAQAICGASAQQQTQGVQQQPPAVSTIPPASASPGTITGTIVDETGAAMAGVRVSLTREDHSLSLSALTDNDGQFNFGGISPGSFQLSITATGFAAQTCSGVLAAGEAHAIPPITLRIATEITQVRVGLSHEEVVEMAEEEIKEEEKQRVLGVLPNFYVTYVPDAAPLTPKQKFELAWRSTIDPVTFLVTAGAAGIEQADNQFSGYGQGGTGYAKRFGASYADTVTGTFIGGAILPSLLKQDPRYFYKGTGTVKSRILYAIANSVICKGDNRRWQPNYSAILGSLAAGGISNLYYPSEDRGAGLTFENTGIGIGSAAAANLLQEFVIRKLTPNLSGNHTNKASNTVSEIWTIIHQGH